MLSRSLYLAGAESVLAELGDELGIGPGHRFAHDEAGTDYSFFTRSESSLFYSSVEGDFQLALDLNLFHIDWPELDRRLLTLSARGIVLAVPDEDAENPFDFLLYEAGEKQSVAMIFNDEIDEVLIMRPTK